jgi:ribosomal protein S18 acetylase RimI-like enzyme
MIRPYRPEDREKLIAMVREEWDWPADEIGRILDAAPFVVYEEAGVPLGCAMAGDPYPTMGDKWTDLMMFVALAQRHQGIGSALWDYVKDRAVSSGAGAISIEYCVSPEALRFFSQKGAASWYSWTRMRYSGSAFPEPIIAARPYEDSDFSNFVRIRNSAFRSLRVGLGMEPEVFPPAAITDELKASFLKDKEDMFMFFENGQPVAVGLVQNRYVNTIGVLPEYRGRGLGRRVTEYCVNRLKERASGDIFLGVVDTNAVARKLYDSMGFVPVFTFMEARCYL